jgi:hypothetical protein
VVQACFAIPLVVATTAILLVQLLTKRGQPHDVDDRVTHLLSDNLGLHNIGLAGIGDESRVDLHHEWHGVDWSNDGFDLNHKLPTFVWQLVGITHWRLFMNEVLV